MGRRQFRQDLAAATENPPPHIHGIETTDDGEISFNYTYDDRGKPESAGLQLLALNVDDYPFDNPYMIFARDGDVSPAIANAFELLCPIIKDKSIRDALTEVSTVLHQAVTTGKSSNPIVVPATSDAEDEGYEETDIEDDDDAENWYEGDEDETFGFEEPKKTSGPIATGCTKLSQLGTEDRKKIKADLREAKEAGFRIGVIGDLSKAGIVSVAIRVSKLGISEEVMKAWSCEPQQYFVLLIRCQKGYRDLESLKEDAMLSGLTEIRLGLCSSYKPNTKSAFDAFNEVTGDSTQHSQTNASRTSTDLQPLFIGRPLNELFKSRFTRIVKFREVFCLGWAGAEQLVHDTQGAAINTGNMTQYDRMLDNNAQRLLPAIVMADTMSERRLKECSLPLVAMQFALRHFVRCTDFCLVCHCSSGSTFEALKPYVCSNPLCLFQYMALGFGPSIEWEILSQPYVVDLLVSFCYAQASAGRLRDFPAGIDLRVPLLPSHVTLSYSMQPNNYPSYRSGNSNAPQAAPGQTATDLPYQVRYNAFRNELLLPAEKVKDGPILRKGDFIAIVSSEVFAGSVIHHRVQEVMLPTVKLGTATQISDANKERSSSIKDKYNEVDCYLYSHHFDELTNDLKARAIMALLDTIPSVKEMLQFLKTHSVGQDTDLGRWRDRISPSALNVLRWIIASNRSCIMQVDNVLDGEGKANDIPLEDRVSGMDEYMQFRFAQGAPDKEQRFIDCVKQHADTKPFPTIFAWHGSPLSNWHSIIREGLHFNQTLHGRAYGNGVYMSPHANTSLSYMSGYYAGNTSGGRSGWLNSELKVSGAMSLNEVVNKPESFISVSPHYVVAELDWIQTRYLLVKTAASHTKANLDDVEMIPQDPTRSVHGLRSEAVRVPITAIAKSRRPNQAQKTGTKKRKSAGSGRIDEPIEIDDDVESVATLNEDREYLLDDESHTCHTPIVLDSDIEMLTDVDLDLVASPKKKIRQEEQPANKLQVVAGCLLDTSKTDFYPGNLDMSNVRRLPPPDDAAPMASGALLKAFRALLKTQSKTAAHELGWYMDPEQVENMYQWIVELHSFDKDIPLAQDMKTAGIASIVLEMRFTNQFPFAPPFVRVIKPRFLPFNQGGGGHVTEGGAICMELLTNNGWSAVSSIESVLLQIRLAMSEKERPGRLGNRGYNRTGDGGMYQVGEAIEAYQRACRAHGWTVPAAFSTLARNDESSSRRSY